MSLTKFSEMHQKEAVRCYALDFVRTKLMIYHGPNDIVALHFAAATVVIRGNWCLALREIRSDPPSMASTAFRLTRKFSSSRPRHDFHFDTHHFVQRLEREGLNRAQAEGIMSAMAEVIDESIRNMTSNMVTKAEQEKVTDPWRTEHHLTFPLVSITTLSKLTLRR